MLIEKDLEKTVGVQMMKDPNQRMTINGEEFVQTIFVLFCPSCGRVIQTFNHPDMRLPNVVETCKANKEALLNNTKSCPNCGQRLNYDLEIMDATYEEHQEVMEENTNV